MLLLQLGTHDGLITYCLDDSAEGFLRSLVETGFSSLPLVDAQGASPVFDSVSLSLSVSLSFSLLSLSVPSRFCLFYAVPCCLSSLPPCLSLAVALSYSSPVSLSTIVVGCLSLSVLYTNERAACIHACVHIIGWILCLLSVSPSVAGLYVGCLSLEQFFAVVLKQLHDGVSRHRETADTETERETERQRGTEIETDTDRDRDRKRDRETTITATGGEEHEETERQREIERDRGTERERERARERQREKERESSRDRGRIEGVAVSLCPSLPPAELSLSSKALYACMHACMHIFAVSFLSAVSLQSAIDLTAPLSTFRRQFQLLQRQHRTLANAAAAAAAASSDVQFLPSSGGSARRGASTMASLGRSPTNNARQPIYYGAVRDRQETHQPSMQETLHDCMHACLHAAGYICG